MRYSVYSILLFVLAFSAVWAYRINYDTREVISQIQVIRAKISFEEEKLSMLEGEWAYLNRPDRLRDLADINFDRLGLLPFRADQYGHLDEVAYPKPELLPITNAIEVSGTLPVIAGDLQ